MSDPTFTDLHSEYVISRMGSLIYERILSKVDMYLRNRDPRIYAEESWSSEDGREDVAQSFVEQVLLREGQLDYFFLVSTDLQDFDKLTQLHLRRFLARTRKRSAVDNMLDRLLGILRDNPFRIFSGTGNQERFGLDGLSDPEIHASEEDIKSAATLAMLVPRLKTTATEKRPRIYDEKGLNSLIQILFHRVRAPLTRSELQEFLELVLSPWQLSDLDMNVKEELSDSSFQPDEVLLANQAASSLFVLLSEQDQIIFQLKFANESDQKVAKALGLSRQSTAPRKAELWSKIQEELSDFDSRQQEAVLTQLFFMISESTNPI